MDSRSASGAAHDADQTFGLENSEGLAQGRARNAQRHHERAFGRQGVPLVQFATDDLFPNLVGDEFRCLGNPDSPVFTFALQFSHPFA